ncbi:calcium sensor EFh [Mesobaculum littorinae]|uniref:Calcium sensor EFh n=1 Tax=Mesobaculum littorinae TaxID=2486419 RepID=A0A438AJE8_9RHOB|nr:calcium sensor EFh [Mesobaculum littorinae]RVV98802.1 calcium sensor EFh [Mesobaculum littorinae]
MSRKLILTAGLSAVALTAIAGLGARAEIAAAPPAVQSVSDGGTRADQGRGRRGPDFATLDTDGDGRLTAEDVAAARTGRFEAADTDGNGTLDVEEIAAAAQRRMARRMVERFDGNGDGALSPDEMPDRGAGQLAHLRAMDADWDGAVTEAEFAARPAQRRGRPHGAGQGWHHHAPHGPARGGAMPDVMPEVRAPEAMGVPDAPGAAD